MDLFLLNARVVKDQIHGVNYIAQHQKEGFPPVKFALIYGKHEDHKYNRSGSEHIKVEVHCQIERDWGDRTCETENKKYVENVRADCKAKTMLFNATFPPLLFLIIAWNIRRQRNPSSN